MIYSKHIVILFSLIFATVLAIGIASCGGHNSNQCSCEICVNDVPAYPCNSEASCIQFMNEQGCTSYIYTTDDTETCGGEAQPVCTVKDCTDACQCPGETDADLSLEFEFDAEDEEQ